MSEENVWHDAGGKKPKLGRGVLVWCPGNKCYYMASWSGSKWEPWNIGATERESIAAWCHVPSGPPTTNDREGSG